MTRQISLSQSKISALVINDLHISFIYRGASNCAILIERNSGQVGKSGRKFKISSWRPILMRFQDTFGDSFWTKSVWTDGILFHRAIFVTSNVPRARWWDVFDRKTESSSMNLHSPSWLKKSYNRAKGTLGPCFASQKQLIFAFFHEKKRTVSGRIFRAKSRRRVHVTMQRSAVPPAPSFWSLTPLIRQS